MLLFLPTQKIQRKLSQLICSTFTLCIPPSATKITTLLTWIWQDNSFKERKKNDSFLNNNLFLAESRNRKYTCSFCENRQEQHVKSKNMPSDYTALCWKISKTHSLTSILSSLSADITALTSLLLYSFQKKWNRVNLKEETRMSQAAHISTQQKNPNTLEKLYWVAFNWDIPCCETKLTCL